MMKPFRSGVLGMVGALATGALVIGALTLGLLESVPQKLAAPTLRATLPAPNLTPLPGFGAPEAPYVSTPRPVIAATSLANPAACPPPTGWMLYTVSNGDDLRTLAETHGSSLEQIMVENCLISDMVLSDTIIYLPPVAPATSTPGATIPNVGASPASTEKACVQPTGWVKYTVKLGDNLTRISVNYRISVSNLKSVNCLAGNIIRTGWQLWVPNVPTSTFTSSPTTSQQPPDTPEPPPMHTAAATLTATWTAITTSEITETASPTSIQTPPNFTPSTATVSTAPPNPNSAFRLSNSH